MQGFRLVVYLLHCKVNTLTAMCLWNVIVRQSETPLQQHALAALQVKAP